MKPLVSALLVILVGAPVSLAQEADPETATASAPTVLEAAEFSLTACPPIGWLSDPNEPPKDIFDALVSGKIHFDNRFRIALADTTARNSSTEITNRIRIGYESKPFYGFSGFVEMENVSTPDEGNFLVPASGTGTSDRTVTFNPPGTEVNQAFGRFNDDALGESGVSLDFKVGRQRIKFDDDRFIGNVGWRQFEQTYDAILATTNFGHEAIEFTYVYVWQVNKTFGPDGPNPDSDSHFIRGAVRLRPEIKVVPFAYLLDFKDDDPLNSSDTFGVRLTGDLWRDADNDADLYADYEFTYAHQIDAGANPINYESDFVAVQFKVTKKQLGHVVAGYQFLGSDDGNFGFRFPLGTNHKFQGFADNFLVTPAVGLQDLYFGVGADLPWGIKAAVTYHEYWSDEGGDDLGEELEFVANKQITPNWSVLVKGGFYDGDSGQPDTTRFWAQTTFKF